MLMKNGGFTKMENELIKYILELVGEHDMLCNELHENTIEAEYCSKHCNNLNENCVRRLIYNRIKNGKGMPIEDAIERMERAGYITPEDFI